MKIFFLLFLGGVVAPSLNVTHSDCQIDLQNIWLRNEELNRQNSKLMEVNRRLLDDNTQVKDDLYKEQSKTRRLNLELNKLKEAMKVEANKNEPFLLWKEVLLAILAGYVFLHMCSIILPWLVKHLISLFGWMTRKLERLMRFFRILTFREPEYIELAMEAMVPGSSLEDAENYPKCVVKIYAIDNKDDLKFTYLGQGFSAGDKASNYIWTAYHVIAPYKKLRIVNANDATKYVDVEKECFQSLDDLDAAILPYDKYTKQLTKLALAKGRIPRIALQNKAVVSVYARGYVTHGTLEADVCGTVRYHGSTLKGFSGSPYIVNNSIFGMHVGCNTGHGVGYDMDFLMAVVKHKREDSYDRVMEEMERFAKRGGKIKYAEYGIDDIQVMWEGRHHILDRQFLKEHFEIFSQVDHPNMLGMETQSWDAAELKEVQKEEPPKNLDARASVEAPGKPKYVDPPKGEEHQPIALPRKHCQVQTQTDTDGHLLILARLDVLSECIKKLQKKPVQKKVFQKSKTPKPSTSQST